jgi:hypothetical protein
MLARTNGKHETLRQRFPRVKTCPCTKACPYAKALGHTSGDKSGMVIKMLVGMGMDLVMMAVGVGMNEIIGFEQFLIG